jgi:hypothetical protein
MRAGGADTCEQHIRRDNESRCNTANQQTRESFAHGSVL